MKLLLANGSELFVNKLGRTWTVDIFPSFHDDGTPVLKGEAVEPTYHAAYALECDAKADAASWATW